MRVFLAVLLLAFTLLNSGFARCGKINVVASIPPLADWAANIGKDYVTARCLLARGASPHTFAPTPSDAAKLSHADIFVMIGLGLEEWAQKFVAAAAPSKLVVLKLGERLGFSPGDNPHIWLDPVLAKKMVLLIADALCRIDPTRSDFFRHNAEEYCERLRLLDEKFRTRLGSVRQKKLVTLHPAFSYLLKRYGLTELAVIYPFPGKQPSVRHLQHVIQLIRQQPVRIILIEPQVSARAARTVAAETSAKLVLVDPLGDIADPKRSNYLKLMEFNLDALVFALK